MMKTPKLIWVETIVTGTLYPLALVEVTMIVILLLQRPAVFVAEEIE